MLNKNNLGHVKKLLARCRVGLLLIVFFITPIIFNNQLNIGNTLGHNDLAHPMELYSLYNSTAPNFDGLIKFNGSSNIEEWSSAAVYYMFNKDEELESKLLIKNDNKNLYIALDMTNQQVESNTTTWGMGLYFARDHNGLLSSYDLAIQLIGNDTGTFVIYYHYSITTSDWVISEAGFAGSPLPSNIIANADFASSYFESNPHRQYEIRVPLAILTKQPGDVIAIGFESFTNYDFSDDEITWPYVSTTPSDIRYDASYWGDVYLAKYQEYSQYSIEEDFYFRSAAKGANNGTFIIEADIDGNGDSELIVSSNRTITGESNAMAIFDYIDGSLVRIWTSWTTSHQSKMFLIRGLAAYDFNSDGKDEIYAVGDDSRILRFSSWNGLDFDSSDYAYTHTNALTGYITIGDATDDGLINIVAGDQIGNILILDYNVGSNSFSQNAKISTAAALGNGATKAHAVQVGDPDDDGNLELLVLFQIDLDNSISTTRLGVYYNNPSRFVDNVDDDLPKVSLAVTEDHFGHTLIVDDVDNDGENEIIIVGQDYLKIFGGIIFTDPSPALEFLVNDKSNEPLMGGGATVADIDDDSFNELIFSANNGTIYIYNITDSGTDTLTYQKEWSSDLGMMFGKRGSMVVTDIDSDGESELITGDSFGQIMIIGRTAPPTISITSPSSGATFSSSPVKLTWESADDFVIHHYDIFINEGLIGSIPGGQDSFFVPLSLSTNEIKVIGYDVNGKNATDSITIGYTALAPEILFISPENNFYTNADSYDVEYEITDPNYNFNYYLIYVNGVLEANLTGTSQGAFGTYPVILGLNGLNNITIIAYDTVGNYGKNSIFIIKDKIVDELEINAPQTGSYTKSSEVQLLWSSTDTLSGIAYFELRLDGVLQGITTNHYYIFNLPIDKSYDIRVTAYDHVGNSLDRLISVTRDTINPNITITSHASGSYISTSTINLVWQALDNIGGSLIHHSEVIVNQVTVYSGTDFNRIINLGVEGVKDILVTVYDLAGNSATKHITIYYDKYAPFIEITSPINNYNTSIDSVILSWTGNDLGTGIKEYLIYINEVLYQTITNPIIKTVELPIPVDTISNITVQAKDFTNKYAIDTVFVNHDSLLSTIMLTSPAEPFSNSSTTDLTISWDIANIPDLNEFIILANTTEVARISELSTRSTIVDVEFLGPTGYPVINITIIANTTTFGLFFFDTKMVKIDRVNPTLSILSPANNTYVFYQGLYVLWSGFDIGTGIQYYSIIENGSPLGICSCSRNYHYMYFIAGDGIYNITILAFDFAGNTISKTIFLNVFLLLPEFSTQLSDIIYTQNGIFNFELSVDNPQSGVNRIIVLMDNNRVFLKDYLAEDEAFSEDIFVNQTHYSTIPGLHTLKIGVVDVFNREKIISYTINIDINAPEFTFNQISIDSQIFSASAFQFTKLRDGPNIHILKITVYDDTIINRVELIITNNDGLYLNYSMTEEIATRATTTNYEVEVDFGALEEGDYQFIFVAYDEAGNSAFKTVNITLVLEGTIPWISQGNNIIYLSVGILVFAALAAVLVVGLRKPILNRNWEPEVIAVLYVRSTGLTCTYIPYNPKLIQEEQLVGGAMIAIQSILEEITGERRKARVETLEIGTKSLLLFAGDFGFGGLLVKAVKPIHKEKLENFTKKYERIYREPLKSQYFVDAAAFEKSYNLVYEFFGSLDITKRITENGLTGQLKEIQETREQPVTPAPLPIIPDKEELLIETAPIDELLQTISKEAKNRLMKIIEATPKVILMLVEFKLDEAEKQVNLIIKDIDFLLKIERTNKDLYYFIQSMMNLTKDIYSGIENGRRGNKKELQLAVEKATKLWFEEIAEKWSAVF
ncbi:MAG: hypothetical protein FK734_20660 [Asgard group archaeon]|nr:hypothetical protein [Asgard group archaeon]